MYTTMELGLNKPSPLGFWGPNSIIVVYMDPLGIEFGTAHVFQQSGGWTTWAPETPNHLIFPNPHSQTSARKP